MIEIFTAAGLILAGVGFILGVLLNQGTLTLRGHATARALDYLVMALWFVIVALFAVIFSR
jgi:hypothetical protein